MSTVTQNSTLSEFDRPTLPTGLNVLTILTYIGSAISFLSSIWSFSQAKKAYVERDKMLEQMNNPSMPAFAKKMMGTPENYMTLVTKGYENRIPILIIGLVSVALCFIGAMQMRKLQKQGYLFYVIGEVLPIFAFVFFVGGFVITGFTFMFIVAIAILFIIMYTVNRKYLVY